MIDIHSHILPGLDDGSQDIETSLSMLKIAQKSGTDTMIATPHYFAGYYETESDKILQHVKELNEKTRENNINVKILPGEEICIDNHTVDLFEKGSIISLNDTSYMLLEFPLDKLPKNAEDVFYELSIRGVKPILAHPERYLFFIQKPSLINDFIGECYFQINTGSIKGIFGKKVQKTALIYMEHGLCNFIASDAHSTGRRCPGVIKEGINEAVYENIKANAEALINDKDIITDAQKIKERSFFSFLRKQV